MKAQIAQKLCDSEFESRSRACACVHLSSYYVALPHTLTSRTSKVIRAAAAAAERGQGEGGGEDENSDKTRMPNRITCSPTRRAH